MNKLIAGFCDPFVLAIIVTCVTVGVLHAVYSKKIDAPAEQVAEAILRAEGIDVDFSSGKKESDGDKQ